MKQTTIYHNPNCGTSRNTLALLRHLGINPNVIFYLETPPNETELRELISKINITPRQLLRTNVPPYEELGLDNSALTDDELISSMLKHPILINRPIVVYGNRAKLCRPSEDLLNLVDIKMTSDFIKEDGEVIYAHK